MAASKRRTSTTVRLAVASVALLGIGAAITTAAWTDNAWFSTKATSASVELYGALADSNGSCPAVPAGVPDASSPWKTADDSATKVEVPAATFANLVPGQTRTAKICLWNGSSTPLSTTLTAIAPATTDGVFGGAAPATIAVRNGATAYATTTLAVGAVTPLDVVVTTPASWPDVYQGKSSSDIAITFTGQTIAS